MTSSGEVPVSIALVPTEDSASPVELSVEQHGISGPSQRAPEQQEQQRQPGDINMRDRADVKPTSTTLDQEDQARPIPAPAEHSSGPEDQGNQARPIQAPADQHQGNQARPIQAPAEQPQEDQARPTQPPAEQEQEERQPQPPTAEQQPPSPEPAAAPKPPSLAGRSCLLISVKPSALVSQLATSLLQRGASVTVAFKHSQDASMFVRSLLNDKHLHPEAAGLLSASAAPVSLASQASVRHFAGSINASEERLDLLVLHTAASSSSRRWYTPEGVAGQAQVGFLGPATLLQLLTPKLAASGTAIMLTASPLHRLGHIDDLGELMTTWAGGSPADTQVALLAYVRQLVQHLKDAGVTAAAVDVGLVREQPLGGSVLRKLPPLQLLHLLPGAADSAHLMASIAEQLLSGGEEGTATGTRTLQQQQQLVRVEGREGEMQQVEGDEKAARAQAGSERQGVVAAQGASAEQQGQEPSQQHGAQAQFGTEEQQGKREGPEAETAGEKYRVAGYGAAEAPAGAVLEGRVGAGTVEGEVESAASQPEPAASTAAGGTGASSSMVGEEEAQAGAQEPQDQAQEQQGPVGEGVSAASGARPSSGQKSFRYFSRGLLATPLITYVDHAGRSTWLSHSLSALTFPLYQLTASSIIRSALLLDWPVRTWLLGPAGALPAAMKPLLGSRAAGFVAQLQRMVPGVEGVLQGVGTGVGVPGWVEVMPAGLVTNERLGNQLWQLVEGSAVQAAA